MKTLLKVLALLLLPVSCFGQFINLSKSSQITGTLDKSHGGTGVTTSNAFVQVGVDINGSFQVTGLHLTGPTNCVPPQFAVGIDSLGNSVCATPAGAGNVSTTGSPASGNLTAFSGATTITNGDLSGDISTSGTLAATLATVNSGPGSCGDSTHVCQVTTNGKGLVTSQAAVGISSSGGTATSVGLALPAALFSISGSPVTTSGTLTGVFAAISGHRYLGNNTSGSATAALVQPALGDLSDFPTQGGNSGKFLTTNGSVTSWGNPAAFQVNGVPLLSTSTIDLLDSASFNGLAATFTNGSAGNIQIGFTGTLGNGGLANSSTVVNGETCTLGSNCAPNPATKTNCANGAAPAVCGSATAGAVAIPTGTNPTLTINTSAVTANSRIFLNVDESAVIAATTCNTTLSTLVQPVVTARSAGVSFTIQLGATIAVNPACVSYFLVN